jgi:hypothetical protein
MEGSSLFLLQTNPNHPVVGVSPSVINASQILVTIQNSGVQLHEVRNLIAETGSIFPISLG